MDGKKKLSIVLLFALCGCAVLEKVQDVVDPVVNNIPETVVNNSHYSLPVACLLALAVWAYKKFRKVQ